MWPSGKEPSDVHAHKPAKLHHFWKTLRRIAPSGNTVQQRQRGEQSTARRQTVHGVFCHTIMNPVKLQLMYCRNTDKTLLKLRNFFIE